MSRLEPGQKAPEWTLKDSTGQQVSLSDFEDRKVIIYFYPAAMTPGCTTQANDFRDNYDVFTKKGYAVLGISPDDTTKLARFVEREEINFPVLSDPEKSVLVAYGAYGEKNLYGKTITGVIRSTVVIDGNGVVTLAKYNVRATGHVASLAKQLNIELD
ncbi:thioredoxin-dependent thiol peroxidase [Ornithinimicrobium sp. INDO-MA30-4]|uniref:thioredoxin-dependent thiol peroxidase n=1 Tax=Ornithinimicrobium sp. INDO-MA30-4 TaxID=2908651 RepID=UPI001F42B978|nr:thioredoxin-dependent thiol peroxidase [Ornithinimicrobium sp. INDO-MA30-4]UJH70687.1 thioredoxin-dependent thiol peroxidase [Ornithinimicrobium sp. INDO-MA30-4]